MGFSLFSYPMLCLLLILFVTVSVVNGRHTYSITNYGAKPDGKTESSKALLAAWMHACKESRSTVAVPGGEFLLNPVRLSGPCAGPITFAVWGVLKAPEKTFLESSEWILFEDLQHLTVTGNGVLDGQGAYAWSVNQCKVNPNCKPFSTNLKFDGVTYGRIEGITSRDSKFFHIVIDESQHVDIENIRITAPADSKNTDGIHIGRSQLVQVNNVDIGTGDDCISLGPGTTNVVISQVNCGPGHGFSIGSIGKNENEDVSGIIVKNCNITNATNGLRIKTWAPSTANKVFNITYQDISLNGVQNPIVIDQHYCPNNQCQHQGESSVEVSNIRYLNIYGSSQDELSANFNCSGKVPCKDIEITRLNIVYNGHQPTKAACYNFNGKFRKCQCPNHCG
ncbi:PREDICTED: exopolygalacturonase-like [Ipomoea nil]|uniref:exopolygalacturonase-like n=1 Tax=Ipomoea nil TaxID=35883 RepID=UPI000900F9FC|nr:PREDICTED: exopolygalacturonase-like [Ipomoea nil]